MELPKKPHLDFDEQFALSTTYPHVWREIATGLFLYADETGQFDEARYKTGEEAAQAVNDYSHFVLSGALDLLVPMLRSVKKLEHEQFVLDAIELIEKRHSGKLAVQLLRANQTEISCANPALWRFIENRL